MELVEFNKAFDAQELKGLIDKALFTAAPLNIKSKWRTLVSMILMTPNPSLAYKIKMWDVFASTGYTDATQDMTMFTSKIMNCPDIDIVRNIIFIEDCYLKWTNKSLLLDDACKSKRDSEGILNTMLGVLDKDTPISNQVRAMVNDHPQVDTRFKHFNAAIEKVLYNNGQLVSTNYTIAPDGKNVTIGGRNVVCGAGNGYYLDAKGALRVSPKWRLVFLPDGNYAIEDSSHAVVVKGDIGCITNFCGSNFGIDIIKVLRDNNIEANLSNNSSTGASNIQEKMQALLDARDEADAVLKQIQECMETTAGAYKDELETAKQAVMRRKNKIDIALSMYDEGKLNPIGDPDEVTEGFQPQFDHVGDTKEDSWGYDLINTLATTPLEYDQEAKKFIGKGKFASEISKDIPTGIFGINQIVEVKEVDKHNFEGSCLRFKGDVDDTTMEWSFKINTTDNEYTVEVDKDAFDVDSDSTHTIMGIYPNVKDILKGNRKVMRSFFDQIKSIELNKPEDEKEKEEKVEESLDQTIDIEFGDSIVAVIKRTKLFALEPIKTKFKVSSKCTAVYNGSIVSPLIEIFTNGSNKSIASATFKSDGDATLTISDTSKEGSSISKALDY